MSVGGYTANNFQFSVKPEGQGSFDAYGAEGMFGLCYFPSSDKKNSTSFFETLLMQRKVANPEFGVFIGRDNEPGEFTLGGYDSS